VQVARCGSARWVLELMKPSCPCSAAPRRNGPVKCPPGPGSGDHAAEPAGAASDVWDCGECDAGTTPLVSLFSSAFLFPRSLAFLLGAGYFSGRRVERGSYSRSVSRWGDRVVGVGGSVWRNDD